MKVLQIYKDVHPFVRGGIERYVHDLSASLAGSGHDVTVLVAGENGRARSVSGFRVVDYPCLFRLLSNPVSPGLGAILESFDADVAHFHVPLPSAVMAGLLSHCQYPYVVTYHSDIVRQSFLLPFYGPFLRRFLKRAYRVLVTSPVYRDTSLFLRDLSNTVVVPIGADLERFTRPEGEPGDYILFVGRFRSYKGMEVLLDAWAGVQERMPCGRRLVLAGGGPLEGGVRRRISSDGLNIGIVNDPSDAELIELYRNAWALVLPSILRSEAYGMVQVEAMACGVPVISTDLPTGVPWVNRDGTTGIVVPPGDPRALGEAMLRMEDPSLRFRYSISALERARENFDASVLFERVEEILKRAVSGE